MEEIFVGFSKPKGQFFPWLSWCIRWLEGTDFSHVFISWKSDSLERELVYEAKGGGVRFVGSDYFNKNVQVMEKFSVPVNNKKQLIQWCIDVAGTSYGVTQLIGMIWVYLAKLFGQTITNPFRNGKENLVCSEMVGYVLRDVLGQSIKCDLDTAGPKAIYEELLGMADAKHLVTAGRPVPE